MINQSLLVKIKEKLPGVCLANQAMGIPTGVSNRHVHLSAEDIEALFGQGYTLTPFKDLKQPGQYAAKECVMVVGSKGSISKVRVLGPARPTTQLEVSKADCYTLGIKAPVRESGALSNSADALMVGPAGHVHLKSQVICAQRHIHMNGLDARMLNVVNGQKVRVKTEGQCGLVFDEVVVRVNEAYALEFHIDTDEANAAGLRSNDSVFITD